MGAGSGTGLQAKRKWEASAWGEEVKVDPRDGRLRGEEPGETW